MDIQENVVYLHFSNFAVSNFKNTNMKFVDRIKEQEVLRTALESNDSNFIVIYGRRRLGKSTLIRRVLKEEDIYFEASLGEKATQISLLARAVATEYPGFDKPVYSSWEDIVLAFNYRCKENATLVLDEFPYLVQRDPALPSTLQRILDRRIVGDNGLRCNIIICGSSQRMMHGLLQGSEPLYGRADHIFILRPVKLPWWREIINVSAKELVEEYAVWGGVPQYWGQRERYPSLDDAIQGLILDGMGNLYDEPARLFLDEVSDIAPYSSIMLAVGSGKQKYSSIADALGKKTAELAKPMKHLIEMFFLRKEVPFGENPSKSKKILYRIEDPFMAFYYRFIEPNKSMIALGRGNIAKKFIKDGFNRHVAEVWERLCQLAVSGNEIEGRTWGVASRWWGKVPIFEEGKKTPVGNEELEFDVVAEDLYDKNTILVGECKWTAPDYADRLLEKLKKKVSLAPFTQGKNVIYVLFLREKPLPGAQNCKVILPEDVESLLWQ